MLVLITMALLSAAPTPRAFWSAKPKMTYVLLQRRGSYETTPWQVLALPFKGHAQTWLSTRAGDIVLDDTSVAAGHDIYRLAQPVSGPNRGCQDHVVLWVSSAAPAFRPTDLEALDPLKAEAPDCPVDLGQRDTTLGAELVRECIDPLSGRSFAFGFDGDVRWVEATFDEAHRQAVLPPWWSECGQAGPWRTRRPSQSYAVESTLDAAGDVVIVQEFRDGVADGNYVVFYPNGRPAIIGNYLDGVPQGTWVWLDRERDAGSAAWFEHGVASDTLPVVVRR